MRILNTLLLGVALLAFPARAAMYVPGGACLPRILCSPQMHEHFYGGSGINLDTNPAAAGSVVGVLPSPGAGPTGWVISYPGVLTATIVGFGTETGISYVDINFSGTAGSTTAIIRVNTTVTAPALPGQQYVFGSCIALRLGPPSGTNYRLVSYIGGGNTALSFTPAAVPLNQGCAYFTTTPLPATATAITHSAFGINLQPSASINETVRIGLPFLTQVQ